MNQWIGSVLICLLFIATTWTAAANVDDSVSFILADHEEDVQWVSLDEAVDVAFENSLALEMAQLDVREAELVLKQTEASNLIQPSPTQLIEARRSLDIAAQQLRLEQFDLKLQVEEDFYAVLQAANLTAIAAEALDISRRQLDIAQRKLESGAETQADVLSASGDLAQAEANLAQAEGGYQLALLNFRRTLGVDYEQPIVPQPSEFNVTPYEVSLEEDIAFALEHRLEIQQLLTALEATKKQVELSDNDYTPELALDMARLAQEKIENQLEQAKRGIALEIRQAHLSMTDAARRITALAKRVEEAEENVRVATQLYELNMAPLLQVLGAQTGLSKAKTDYVHAIFDYNLARAKYDRAVARPLRNEADR